ncbi:MAG: hypothetical protein VB070_09200 [Clostridiaceae bacterium]|nr:hypothetical protein [Clostridiaceae bacterium]
MLFCQPRPILRTTSLLPPVLVTLVAPKNAAGKTAVQAVRDCLLRQAAVTVLENPSEPESVLYQARGPLIIIGNLADNSCVRVLYYKSLAATDLTYPGPGGYEIRTLLDPFATGYNIIHIGYSDQNGLSKAAALFLHGVQEGMLPYYNEICAVQLPLPAEKARQIADEVCNPADPTAAYNAPIDEKGYLAYLTGDCKLLADYVGAWRLILLKQERLHLKLYRRAAAWRLLEMTGMLPDDLRAECERFFYEWADGPEGWGSILEPIYQLPDFPRQNHGLIPALGLVILADYFGRFYPEMDHPAQWRRDADQVFSVYDAGHWKPLCDGLCHGWWLSQPAMLEYGLFDDRHAYFTSGGARQAALCAMAVVNNEGWMPNAGDMGIQRQFPIYNLSISAAYYQDGRYAFMKQKAPLWRQGYSGPLSYLPRAFDTGLTPAAPRELVGATVIPMDSLVYDAWSKEPALASLTANTAPSAPIERCFDKLSVRTGLGPDDEFLLIDGLSGGSHAYDDAMAILDYQKYGVSFLVSEDQLYWIEPENHCSLTIYRNGCVGPLPGFAELEDLKQEPDGRIYLSLRLRGFDGADWHRELYFLPDQCLVIQDTVLAIQEGLFSVESHYRTPGQAALEGTLLQSRRRTRDGRAVQFQIKTIASQPVDCQIRTINLHNAYRPLPGEKPPVAPEVDPVYFAQERYHLESDELCLTAYTAKTTVRMAPGQSLTLTTVIRASADLNAAVDFVPGPENLGVNLDGTWIKTPLLSRQSGLTRVTAAAEDPAGFSAAAGKAAGGLAARPATLAGRLLAGFKSRQTVARLAGERLLCGFEDGRVAAVDDEGNIDQLCRTAGAVHDLASDAGYLYVAYGPDKIACYAEDQSRLLWQVNLERIPTLYPWWELDTPLAARIQIGRLNGLKTLLAGCGDNSLRFFSPEGLQLDAYSFFAAVPNLIELADLDGDGQDEILLAGNLMTCISQVDVLRADHTMIDQFGSEDWTSIAKVLRCFSFKGKPAVALGVNHRHNLKVYVFTNDGSMKHQTAISERLPGAVADIVIDEANEQLAACTTQGILAVYRFTGERCWTAYFNQPLCSLIWLHDEIWAADESGRVVVYQAAGQISRSYDLPVPIRRLLLKNGRVLALGDQEIYRLPFPETV